MSSARAFVRAIQTRSTNTTRSLEQLFRRNPNTEGPHPLASNPNLDLLSEPEALNSGPNGGLPSWAKAELVQAGLSAGPEVDHLDNWPADQREAVREKLVEAIEENLSIRFFWELHDGYDEETQDGQLETGDIVLTFRSPKRKVRVVGPDNIIVDV